MKGKGIHFLVLDLIWIRTNTRAVVAVVVNNGGIISFCCPAGVVLLAKETAEASDVWCSKTKAAEAEEVAEDSGSSNLNLE